MKDINILITGGSGNIGSSLLEGLLKFNEYKVTVVDNLSTGSFSKIKKFQKDINFYQHDVNNYNQISDVFSKHSFDYIFHLAAVVGVKRTIDNPLDVLNDINGFTNIFSLAQLQKLPIKRIFYASSSEVYGEPVETPLVEDSSPLNTQLPYAKVKSIGESFCKSYFKEFGLPYTAVRLFNTYGPNQSEDFVISKFIESAISGKDITIYGDGKQTRTFCYVDDTVNTFIKMLRDNKAINQTINVGSHNEIEIGNLAILIKNYLNSNSNIINIEALEEGDMTRRCPDNSKMLKIIKQDLITLEEGIHRTAQHKKTIK